MEILKKSNYCYSPPEKLFAAVVLLPFVILLAELVMIIQYQIIIRIVNNNIAFLFLSF